MRKVILACAILALGMVSYAQDGTPQNVIKVNPVGLLFGSANLTYEKALNEKSSIGISPAFGFLKTGGYKYTTYGLGAEYRYYLSKTKTAPAGMYVGPGVGYAFGKAVFDDSMYGGSGSKDEIKVSGISAKAVLGHQWVWNSGFSLDLNGGVQYFSLKASANDDPLFSGFSGVLPALGFSIGYAF